MNNGSQVSLNVLLWHFAITRNMRTLNNGPRQKVLTLQYVTTFAVTSCFLREGNKGCQMFQWLAIHLWHMCRGTLVPLHHFCMDVLFFRCVRAQWRCCCYWRARSGAPERGTHTHTHTDAALQHVTLLCSEAMKDKIPHSQVSERQFTHQFKGRGFEMP